MATAPEQNTRPPGTPAGRGYRLRRCAGCGLTDDHCICDELPRLHSGIAIDIVVHWRELRKPTNTARLVARMLTSCRLLVRGGPRPDLGRDVAAELAHHALERTLLLYPSEHAEPLAHFADSPTPLRLIVPDGAWSQTQRLVRRESLGRFRTVSLPAARSAYVLRRGARSGLLCTLEAVAAALDVLGESPQGHALRAGFTDWQRRATTIRKGPQPVARNPSVRD